MPLDREHSILGEPVRAWEDSRGLGHQLWQRHALSSTSISRQIPRVATRLHEQLLRNRTPMLNRLLRHGGTGRRSAFGLSELPLFAFLVAARPVNPSSVEIISRKAGDPSMMGFYDPRIWRRSESPVEHLREPSPGAFRLQPSSSACSRVSRLTGDVFQRRIVRPYSKKGPRGSSFKAISHNEVNDRPPSSTPYLFQSAFPVEEARGQGGEVKPLPSMGEKNIFSWKSPKTITISDRVGIAQHGLPVSAPFSTVDARRPKERFEQSDSDKEGRDRDPITLFPASSLKGEHGIATVATAKPRAKVIRQLSSGSPLRDKVLLGDIVRSRIHRSPESLRWKKIHLGETAVRVSSALPGYRYREVLQRFRLKAPVQDFRSTLRAAREASRYRVPVTAIPVQRLRTNKDESRLKRTLQAVSSASASRPFFRAKPMAQRAAVSSFFVGREAGRSRSKTSQQMISQRPNRAGKNFPAPVPLPTNGVVALDEPSGFGLMGSRHIYGLGLARIRRSGDILAVQSNLQIGGMPAQGATRGVVHPSFVRASVARSLPSSSVVRSAGDSAVRRSLTSIGWKMLWDNPGVSPSSSNPATTDVLMRHFLHPPVAVQRRSLQRSRSRLVSTGRQAFYPATEAVRSSVLRRPWVLSLSPSRSMADQYPEPAIMGQTVSRTGLRGGATVAHLTEKIRFAPSILTSRTRQATRHRASHVIEQGITSDGVLTPFIRDSASVSNVNLSRTAVYPQSKNRAGPLLNLKPRDPTTRGQTLEKSNNPGNGEKPSIALQRARVAGDGPAHKGKAFPRPALVVRKVSVPALQEQMLSTKLAPRFSPDLPGTPDQNQGSPAVRSGPVQSTMPLVMPFNTDRLRALASAGTAGATIMETNTQPVSSRVENTLPAAIGQSPQTSAREAPAGSASPEQVNVDNLVQKVWRKLMHRLTIEQERRGATRWP